MSTKLTENKVRSEFQRAVQRAKERKKKVGCAYEDGMYLCVQASGRGADWHLKYTFGNRAKEISLMVSYPRDNSLKIARQRRDEAKLQLEDGRDPSALRKGKRAEGADTLMLIAKQYLDTKEKEYTKAKGDEVSPTRTANEKRLEKYIYPSLGRTPIRSITALELLAVLRRIVDGEKNIETARRICSLCAGIWGNAVLQGQADSNIAAGLHRLLAKARKKHFAAIVDPRQFGELLRAIDGYSGQPLTRLALQLMALVFVRSFEMRRAEWSEFDLDDVEPTWRIPAVVMKMKDPHIVALAPQTVAILREIEIHSGGGRLVFPGLRSPARCMSENTLNSALRGMGYDRETHVTHGFRSTASTLLNEMNVSSDLIELQLAHSERDSSRASYNFATKLGDRRKMMLAWADRIDVLRAGGNVIPMRRKAS